MERPSGLTWLFILIALVALYYTNPSVTEHRLEAKKQILNAIQKNLAASTDNILVNELGAMFGMALMEETIDRSITRQNYFIFSTTEFSLYGVNETIGVGFLGRVFISDGVGKEIDKLFKKGKEALSPDEKRENNTRSGAAPADTLNSPASETQQARKEIMIGKSYQVLASPSFPVAVYNSPDNTDGNGKQFSSGLWVKVKDRQHGFAYVVYDDSESSDDFIEGWIEDEYLDVN